MPELPAERKIRYMELGLEGEQADIFVEDITRGNWFDILIENLEDKTLSKENAKWVVGDISGQLEKRGLNISESPVSQRDLIYLIELVKQNQISGTIAKDVINQIFEGADKSAEEIIKEQNLIQISDSSEIEQFVSEVISENQKVVADISKNPNAIKFLVGQVMKLSKGKVNPKVAEEELKKALNIN